MAKRRSIHIGDISTTRSGTWWWPRVVELLRILGKPVLVNCLLHWFDLFWFLRVKICWSFRYFSFSGQSGLETRWFLLQFLLTYKTISYITNFFINLFNIFNLLKSDKCTCYLPFWWWQKIVSHWKIIASGFCVIRSHDTVLARNEEVHTYFRVVSHCEELLFNRFLPSWQHDLCDSDWSQARGEEQWAALHLISVTNNVYFSISQKKLILSSVLLCQYFILIFLFLASLLELKVCFLF